MRSGARSRLELDQDIRQAVDRGELRVQYQPIVSLRSGAVSGLEALIRWQHPRHGLLLPANFLSAAEDAGVLVDIEEWLLAEVFDRAPPGAMRNRAWNRSLLSASTFRQRTSATRSDCGASWILCWPRLRWIQRS